MESSTLEHVQRYANTQNRRSASGAYSVTTISITPAQVIRLDNPTV